MVDDRGVIYEGARGWVSVGGDGPHAAVSRWARVALLLAQVGDGWVFARMDGMDRILGWGAGPFGFTRNPLSLDGERVRVKV